MHCKAPAYMLVKFCEMSQQCPWPGCVLRLNMFFSPQPCCAAFYQRLHSFSMAHEISCLLCTRHAGGCIWYMFPHVTHYRHTNCIKHVGLCSMQVSSKQTIGVEATGWRTTNSSPLASSVRCLCFFKALSLSHSRLCLLLVDKVA